MRREMGLRCQTPISQTMWKPWVASASHSESGTSARVIFFARRAESCSSQVQVLIS